MFHAHFRKGDYCRYKAEFSEGEKREEASQKSLDAYEKANETAKELKSTHPISLGLSLNFSVFYYEIMNDSRKACEIAKMVSYFFYMLMEEWSTFSYMELHGCFFVFFGHRLLMQL